MYNFKNKIEIVTAAASGIGLATVKAFVEKGAKVVIADYNEEGGKKVENELKENGADVTFIYVNAADENSVENLVKETVHVYDRLDIIVNNAGNSSHR